MVAGPDDIETKRLEARRHREQERMKKLGPGWLRTIGADIAGVKNQIEEKQRERAAELEAQRRDDEEQQAIRRYLLQVESEDALAKRREMLTLRNDWKLQVAVRDDAKAQDAYVRSIGIDPDVCAPGAAQKFDGEDPRRLERARLQAQQMKQWTTQQMEERKQREAQEAEDQAKYMSYLFEIERLQQSLHDATEKERAQISVEIARYNQLMLAHRREQERQRAALEQQQNAQEVDYTTQSYLVSENPLAAQLPGVPLDQRVRVDHWKGFSSDQTRTFLSQNDKLLADKARQQELTRQAEQDEAKRLQALQHALAEEALAMQRRKAQQQLQLKYSLDQQALEAAERERKNAEQARGKIEPGFFQGFGRSYR
ncbi:TPA: hypothetical protein N0F65_008711 [Lagenidium giganteum]|uniref:RIB43A-like with coiled-coils protein 1 n=1 Tax=Lagenidium giganteum TaxID=4803 RepID=A0AAV2YSE2_9STRA|nr:TPA: hypothetical protein N0F65_008711 [Lagenidium giganteum]